jgi:hypothetical protein
MPTRSFRHGFCILFFALIAMPAFAQAPAAVATTPTVDENPALVQRYQNLITPELLASHLYFLASDFFEGREAGAPGQRMAAEYLASQYRLMGVTPAGTAQVTDPLAPEAYYQPVPLFGHRLVEARLDILRDGQPTGGSAFGPKNGFDGRAFLGMGNVPEVEGSVVFAGYGIADNSLGYNDYAALAEAGIDLEGKWLMVLRDEPMAAFDRSLLRTDDGGPSNWTTSYFNKVGAARQSNARGMLIVGDVGPRVELPLAVRADAALKSMGSLSLRPGRTPRAFLPVYVISREMADEILGGSNRTVERLQAEIDGAVRPVVFEVENTRLRSAIRHEPAEIPSENVLALIEGTDLRDEVIVITSHYDHVGFEPMGDGDIINNGADDDGSGTVGTLALAKAFMAAKADGYAPRRSILFLNVTAEEKGLLGSAYYADVEPIFPLENTVVNLNMDMIGRFDPTHPTQSENYVYIIGSYLISQELHDINVRVNELTGIHLKLDERFNDPNDPNGFYRRSDQWNFGKHNIPFIFFFTGTHEDYHAVGDRPEKIEYDRMARIVQLVFATAWQVANQDGRPAVTGPGFN